MTWFAKHKIEVLTAGMFFILLFLRLFNMDVRSPEYDELWTVHYYVNIPVSKIFTDVATPNNHPLNSFLIRTAASFSELSFFIARLPALLAFCGLFALCIAAARNFISSPVARAAFLLLVILNGGILHYAETARGYSLQTFFFFAAFLSLLLFEKFREQKKKALLYALLYLVSAVGTCFSISSGIILITALTASWWFFHTPFRKGISSIFTQQKTLWISFLLFALFVLLWYVGNYSEFAKGRNSFGENISGIFPFLLFAGSILYSTGMAVPLLTAVCGILLVRAPDKQRLLRTVLCTVILVLLSAIALKGGPPRVYLPLFPLSVFAFGIFLDDLLERSEKLRQYANLILVAICAAGVLWSNKQYQEWSEPDLGSAFRELQERANQKVFIAYRPTDAYVILSIFGETAMQDNLKRANQSRSLMLLHDNVLGCMRISDNNTLSFPMSSPASESGILKSGIPYWVYPLRKVSPDEKMDGKIILCFFSGNRFPAILDPNSWLMKNFHVVNFFFTNELTLRKQPVINVFAAKSPAMTPEEMTRLQQEDSNLRFYVVGE